MSTKSATATKFGIAESPVDELGVLILKPKCGLGWPPENTPAASNDTGCEFHRLRLQPHQAHTEAARQRPKCESG